MSKVFSAKRKKVEFTYEFLDGKKENIVVRSLSSKEQLAVSGAMIKRSAKDDPFEKTKKAIRMQLADNDKKIVEKILKEQFEDGDLILFTNALAGLISEERAKK